MVGRMVPGLSAPGMVTAQLPEVLPPRKASSRRNPFGQTYVVVVMAAVYYIICTYSLFAYTVFIVVS